jgi:hypothetical protein
MRRYFIGDTSSYYRSRVEEVANGHIKWEISGQALEKRRNNVIILLEGR